MKAMASAAVRAWDDEITDVSPRQRTAQPSGTSRSGGVVMARATDTARPPVTARPAEAPSRHGTGTTGRTAGTRPAGPSATAAPSRAATGVTGRAPAARTVTASARRPATAGRHAPRAPFALLVVGLLGGALVGLLLLNTTLAQQSFTRSELVRENQRLAEAREALQEDIARESSPQVLHEKARRLGMRDGTEPGFVGPRR